MMKNTANNDIITANNDIISHPGEAGGSVTEEGLTLGRRDGMSRVCGVWKSTTSNLSSRRIIFRDELGGKLWLLEQMRDMAHLEQLCRKKPKCVYSGTISMRLCKLGKVSRGGLTPCLSMRGLTSGTVII